MNRLAAILPASNVLVDVDASSKKRVFEQAGLLFENQHAIARGTVTDNLFARERSIAGASAEARFRAGDRRE